MTHSEIASILDTDHANRTDGETKACHAAMRKIAFALPTRAFRLLSIVSAQPRGAVRIPGTDDFTVTTTVRRGRTIVHTFSNGDLRPIVDAGLANVTDLGNGVAVIEPTRIGRIVPSHKY